MTTKAKELLEFLEWSIVQFPNNFGNKEDEHRKDNQNGDRRRNKESKY
ncbi:7924_t:CDS:1, partial [Gigaspora rosea]